MKPGLAPDKHADLGAALEQARSILNTRYVQVANAYPLATAQVRRLKVALDALDDARSALDDAMAREHPREFSPRVYYPRAGGTS